MDSVAAHSRPEGTFVFVVICVGLQMFYQNSSNTREEKSYISVNQGTVLGTTALVLFSAIFAAEC